MNDSRTLTIDNGISATVSALLLSFASMLCMAQQPDITWSDYYQSEQAEILADRARQAMMDGRYPEAELQLDQALQIIRVSQGLHNPAQLALVDQLLETLLLQGKWEEFDQKLDYISWLNGRINADNPDQLANGLLRQSDWHRAAAGVIQRSQSAWYLIQGKYLNWQAVSILENQYGKQDTRLAPVLYQIVLEHYYQSVLNERRGTTSYEFKSDDKSIANGWMLSRNESVRRSYRIGRENLQRIRDLYSVAPGVARSTDALLQIYQADWEFLHGNNRLALELYQDAYFELLAAGIGESEVEGFFNQLIKLPAQVLQTDWLEPEMPDNELVLEFYVWSTLYPGVETPAKFLQPPFQPYSDDSSRVQLEVKLEVSGNPESGSFDYGVTGLNIVTATLDAESVANRVFAEVPLLKFRPRLEAGELAAHRPFLVNYRFARD